MTQKWWASVLAIPVLCAALVIAPVMAQESEDDTADAETQSEAVETEETPVVEDEEPTRRAADTLDTFVPSEEVSSDLSVSFPVDI